MVFFQVFRFPARLAALVPLLFALVFPAHAAAALFAAEGRDIRAEIEAARLEGRRLAVVFELPDCANCLKMKREVFSDQRAETDFGRAYRTVRIDLASVSPITDARGEVRTPQEFAQGLGLFATPSFAFFASDGSLEYRHAGGLASPSDLMRLGRFVAEALYEERPFSDYLHSSVKHHH